MKVYVITAGEYSDYHIVGVTLDERTADKYVKEYNARQQYSYNFAGVHEYDTESLDCGYAPIFTCVYNKESGEYDIELEETDTYYCPFVIGEVIEYHDSYVIYILAKDEEHAKKIALDKIAKYRAEKEGVKV